MEVEWVVAYGLLIGINYFGDIRPRMTLNDRNVLPTYLLSGSLCRSGWRQTLIVVFNWTDCYNMLSAACLG